MEAQIIALVILVPFTLAFVYAGFHEFRRYKTEGRATYGLAFDEETGTTHVTGIPDGKEAYNPDDYDPSDYNDPDTKSGEAEGNKS
ncbi:hypothetical protein [Salipiger mucosus]|uniref:Uncharacterized protein n=1 Tax=Salipiger mucosus DSM 16094 TaxID=1123237 RepID=S9SCQ4_9RHOB|nr:hypothetical protein [Salipiger mucosus]EPX84014.1 hypothetical protein Salmuc_01789 [Salipiger mucosus DSM 16094]